MRRLLCLAGLLAYTCACIVLLSIVRPQEAVCVEPPPTCPDRAMLSAGAMLPAGDGHAGLLPTYPSRTPLPAAADKPPCLGEYRVTVYTPHCDGGVWGYQTATGVTSAHLATCAVDPAEIPLGTVLDVGGLLVTAVDVGGAVKGQVIDVFYDGTPAQAQDWLAGFGDSAQVWICEEATP